MIYKEKIKNELKSASSMSGLCYSDDFAILVPENTLHGDYAVNIFKCAKDTNIKPINLGKKIISNLSKTFYDAELLDNGYINFKIKKNILISNLYEILKLKEKYAQENIGKNNVVVIDFSSPNIAKPMSVGNIRSTIIGSALYNIYKYLGYKVIGDNHLGDWGTQFGKLIYAYKKWGINKRSIDVKFLLWLYVKFHNEVKDNPKLDEYARAEFKLLENGDKENIKIWQKFRNISIREFNKIYKLLNIKFDKELGESFYNIYLKNVIKKALLDGIAKESDGAIVIPFSDVDNIPPLLIQKSDGTTLYATRDLATLEYRAKKFRPKKVIYVIGNEQKLYLRELFLAFKKMGYGNIDFIHVGFGLIRLKDEKMSTRTGNIILLEDLINQAIIKSKTITLGKNKNISKSDLIKSSHEIGIGAIKYNDLSQNRKTDIVFDLDKMLSLTGNSSLYLQYTYARAKKIIDKAVFNNIKINKNIEILDTENEILKKMLHFKEIICESASNYEPNHIANYLYNLANLYNYFYQKNPILKEENIDLKTLRIMITKAVMIIIKTGLKLLGINTLNKI